MEYLLSILWSFIEIPNYMVLNSAFLHSKYTRKKLILFTLILNIVATTFAMFCKNQVLKSALAYSLLILFSYFSFHGGILKSLLITVIFIIFSGTIDAIFLYGVCFLLGIPLSQFIWRKLAYTLVVTTSKLISLLIAWIIYKARQNKKIGSIRKSWMALTVIFPCISIAMLSVIYVAFQNREDLSLGAFLFSIGLVVSNIAILYAIHIMEKQAQDEQEVIMLNQQMQVQTESILALEKSYRAQRQATHEFRHHVDTVSGLLASGELQAAKDYLLHLQNTQTTRVLRVNSHHPIIDAILNQKFQLAQENSIDMQFQVNDLSGVNIETDYLVVLLSNLLDNAIEACQRIEKDRSIHCRLLAEEYLFISVRNTSYPITFDGENIPTSKVSKEEHGYGLANIKRILSNLNAEYTYEYHDGWFEFVIEIPM